ncbi:MAG: hypothetical protein QNK83_11410 [Akkermansiaceae bacterium]|nr:hypothetical protein [Akkermansiaceae bacterium]
MTRVLLLLILCLPLRAHYDVNAAVAALTVEIKAAPTADLYYRRAVEFRALREKAHAISDLRASLKLKPHSGSFAALAELLSDRGEHREALQLGERLLKLDPAPAHSFLLAELSLASGDSAAALRHIQNGPPAKDATHLLHAHLLEEKGDSQKAAVILKAAHNNTKSIVLRNSWLDAAISAGLVNEVLPTLNLEIETSRFSASHRIRRARLLMKEDPKLARQDLTLALAELAPRIQPARPDLTLIHDRGLALALLDRQEEARRDLALLQATSLSPLSYALLIRALR